MERNLEQRIKQLYYEDLAERTDAKIQEISLFLRLPFCKCRSDLKKQNTEPLNVLIENYDELKKNFENSKWASFIIE